MQVYLGRQLLLGRKQDALLLLLVVAQLVVALEEAPVRGVKVLLGLLEPAVYDFDLGKRE